MSVAKMSRHPLCCVSLCLVSRFIYCYAERRYCKCSYAECHYAVCYFAECRGALFKVTRKPSWGKKQQKREWILKVKQGSVASTTNTVKLISF